MGLTLHVGARSSGIDRLLTNRWRGGGGPLGAGGIDYLQLVDGEGRGYDNRTQEVGTISRGLKAMAKDLGVPVIACAQLSRALEQRPNRRPVMSDLRESGALEQDANLILALYRDSVYNTEADPTHAELLILKNRQGPSGTIALDWEGQFVRFRNTTRVLRPAAAPEPGGAFGGVRGYNDRF